METNETPHRLHRLLSPASGWAAPDLLVADAGEALSFSVRDAFMYHGYDAPGGVALGWRLLQRAFALLAPGETPERREFTLFTSFPGLGLRDTMELTTRMVSGNRFSLDVDFPNEAVQEGVSGKPFFRFGYRGKSVDLAPLEGHPDADFIRLGRASKRPGFTPEDAARWTAAKFVLANALLAVPADAVIRVL